MRIDNLVLNAAAAQRCAPDLQKLEKSANELEASFVKQLLATMRKSVPDEKLGQQYGGTMFQDMFDDSIAQSVTKRIGLGIADQVVRHAAPEVVRQEVVNMRVEAQRAKAAATTEETR